MSMGLYVVLALATAPSSDEINSAAKELNIPIEISAAELTSHSGFLPVKVAGNDSGVQTFIYPATEAKGSIPENEKIDISNSIVFEFRWGGNFKEAAAAFYTAQVLTMKYKGVAFDPESGIFLGPEQIAQGAEVFANLPE
jgi:hypothetical protein